ncbi:NACHT domain-containing protein [Micromonospora sp. BQ11]|uniref:NACHT domain-containing protein n=1 Tax=Micromonospora sp. BQ11 TaxID=3452212 RepID=UPI003F89A6DA
MPDTLSYADAVRLLGGEKSRFVDWFDKLTGGALLAASVPVPALLGLFDAKAEFVRLGHDLVRTVSEKRSGLSRYGRTQRLEAAHAVIAVTAFFEALDGIDFPFDVDELRAEKPEQLFLGGAAVVDPSALTHALFATSAPGLNPHLPYPELRGALGSYYRVMTGHLLRFVTGLSAWERLGAQRQAVFRERVDKLTELAVDRHHDLLTQLAVQFPEVSFWAGLHAHEATRAEVRTVATGLVELRHALEDLSTGRVPDERRAALARAYADELTGPIISSGDVPAGLRVPTLGTGYVPPLCRVAALDGDARPSDESWWADREVRADLTDFLTGHVTSPGATRAPLLVLGQPGSGKSVLTRVLAAHLPAADFLVVRVVLREVQTGADLQDQIEQAIRAKTGERLEWPALARSAGDALPVVLLDGFDELLQATGVTQTDYLLKVAAFQRREAAQGRPVAVLVTTRTSVADRAKPPPGTVALRLEPFDETRMTSWVSTWNAVNADRFPALGVAPLDPSAVIAHRELAEQPLLLLMLALYDADGNDLRSAGELRRGELYERLLHRFARREVVKHRPGLPDRELDRAIEGELRRLAVVAFAMFNRGVQWVAENDLESDLAALPFLTGGPVIARAGTDLQAPLRPAEIVLGRFFFVHRSRALRDDHRLETYEFLHATFGEFLVARTVALVLGATADRAAASSLLSAASVDDDPLHALLSFATVTGRAPIVAFLAESMQALPTDRRLAVTDLLLQFFRAADAPRAPRQFASYRPAAMSVPARHAAYSANLLVLVLCVGDEVHGSELFPESADDVRSPWTRQALLWRSQLGAGEYRSLVMALRMERLGPGERREIRLSLDNGHWRPPPIDPSWTYGITAERTSLDGGSWVDVWPDPDADVVHRMTNFECGLNADITAHALEPLWRRIPPSVNSFGQVGEEYRSAANTLLTALLPPFSELSERERGRVYEEALALSEATAGVELWRGVPRRDVTLLLLDRLATDARVSAEVIVNLLERHFRRVPDAGVLRSVLRCCRSVLDQPPVVDERLAVLVDGLIPSLPFHDNDVMLLVAEVELRLVDRGSGHAFNSQDMQEVLVPLLDATRPDLARRLRRLMEPSLPKRDGA